MIEDELKEFLFQTHGVLNAVSWGIMMPIGAIIARYLKVFKSADPAWFYLHVICQASAYIVGVAGWGLGLKLGSDSASITYDTHRTLGIILFCLGTLQVRDDRNIHISNTIDMPKVVSTTHHILTNKRSATYEIVGVRICI